MKRSVQKDDKDNKGKRSDMKEKENDFVCV